MKVQLNTNYSQRNFTQKTNKAETYAKQNFAGVVQVTMPMGAGLNLASLQCIANVFQSHTPTSIIKDGIDLISGFHYARASFESSKDAAVMKSLLDAVKNQGEKELRWTYTTERHGLSKERLRRIDLAPKYKSMEKVAEEQAQVAFADSYGR